MRGNSKYFSKRIYLNMHCLLPKEGLQLLCQFFVAINKLGMVYASSGQVVTYNDQDGDYVRQYEDVPAE